MLEDDPEGERPSDDLTKPRKELFRSKWKHSQDAVSWVNSARAEDKALQFWQTRSNAIVVYNSVLADCIYKVLSQKGKRVSFERLSTPRSAPTFVLKSSWQKQQQQQQQQDTSESASARSWKQSTRSSVKEELKDNPGNPTKDSETPRSWKQNCKKDSSVEEKP